MSPWVLQHLLEVCWSCDPHQNRGFHQSLFPWGAFREQSCDTPAATVGFKRKSRIFGKSHTTPCPLLTGSTARSSYWAGKTLDFMDRAPAKELFLWSVNLMAPHPFSSQCSAPKFQQLLQDLGNLSRKHNLTKKHKPNQTELMLGLFQNVLKLPVPAL